MKDSYIYQRMNSHQVMKSYYNILRTAEMSIVQDLYNNITENADDHPNYPTIVEVYQERLNADNNLQE